MQISFVVFGPNFREGQKFSGGKLPRGGANETYNAYQNT